MDFVLEYSKGMVEKFVEINESLKCNLHYWGGGGGKQPQKKKPQVGEKRGEKRKKINTIL